MPIYKNLASQKLAVYAHDSLTDSAKTGDADNITAYISKDGGSASQTNDVHPTELDATNLPGVYVFDLTQAETNCDLFVLCAQSSTSGVVIMPVIEHTVGLELDIDSTGQGLTAKKALEAIVAVLAGNASYDSSTGVWTIKGRDGSTTVVQITETAQGTRSGSTIS